MFNLKSSILKEAGYIWLTPRWAESDLRGTKDREGKPRARMGMSRSESASDERPVSTANASEASREGCPNSREGPA